MEFELGLWYGAFQACTTVALGCILQVTKTVQRRENTGREGGLACNCSIGETMNTSLVQRASKGPVTPHTVRCSTMATGAKRE